MLTVLGLLLTLPLTFGPLDGRAGHLLAALDALRADAGDARPAVDLHGRPAQIFFDYSGAITKRWLARFPYDRTVGLAVLLFVVGLGFGGSLIASYVRHGLRLPAEAPANYAGVTGVLFMIAGFTTFTFTLLLHATTAVVWRRD